MTQKPRLSSPITDKKRVGTFSKQLGTSVFAERVSFPQKRDSVSEAESLCCSRRGYSRICSRECAFPPHWSQASWFVLPGEMWLGGGFSKHVPCILPFSSALKTTTLPDHTPLSASFVERWWRWSGSKDLPFSNRCPAFVVLWPGDSAVAHSSGTLKPFEAATAGQRVLWKQHSLPQMGALWLLNV